MSLPPHDPSDRSVPSPGPGPDPQQPSQQPAPGGWDHQQPVQDGWGQQPAQGDWGRPAATSSAASADAPWGQPPAPAGPAVATGPAPGADLGADLGAALKFAGNALLRNPVAFLVAGAIYGLVSFALIIGAVVVGFLVMIPQIDAAAASDTVQLGPILAFYGIILAGAVLTIPIMLLWQTGSGRAGGLILEGGRPGIGQAMAGPMRIVLTALLVGAIIVVGTILFYLPGLVAGVLLMFAIPAAVRGASPGAALKESVLLAKDNLGTTIVTYLVISVISSIVGMFVITMIVVVPFAILLQLGMYERLNGREMPEPAAA